MKNAWKKFYDLAMKKYALLGSVFALVLIGAGAVWFTDGSGIETLKVTRGEFVQSVSISGKVVAANEVDLSFSQSGRIARVNVREGERVGVGELIAELENGDLYALLLQKQAALERERAELDALKSGTRPEEIAVYESAVESARSSLDAQKQAVVDAILSAFSTTDSALHATVDTFISNPNTGSPQLTFLTSNATLESSVELKRVTMESLLSLWSFRNATLTAEGDLVLAADEAQSALQEFSVFLNDVGSVLASSVPTPNISQGTLDGYKTSVATARTNVNASITTLTTALKAQSAAKSALVTAERDLILRKVGASPEDIRAQEANIKAAEADVLNAEAQLRKTQIKSPFAGTVTKIEAKVGKSVAPSELQASVIGTGAFQVETYIPEINVGLIRTGNLAVVSFDAYGSDVVFDAEVASIDLGETVRDGVSTYRTILVFKDNDARIRSGMTANVLITALTKPDVLQIPQKLVVIKNGSPTVLVLDNGTIVERTVTSGLVSSSGMIEILSGLRDGDEIVLE